MDSVSEERGKTEFCLLSPPNSTILQLNSQGQGMTHWITEIYPLTTELLLKSQPRP